MLRPSRQAFSWERVLLAGAAAAGLLASPAGAQYFGHNDVRYRRFDFQVLKTPHFDIYHYPEERAAVQHASRMAERWYARLSKLLAFSMVDRQPLILYASHPHFQQTNTLGGAPGEGTGGVTESFKRRVILPFAGALAETDHVLGHELVHAFQYAITGQGHSLGAPAERLPLWFIEGMAEYLSIGPVDPHTAMWMREAAREEKLPSIDDLRNPRYFPYRYGQALWAYIGGRWGDPVIGEILKAAGRSGDGEGAIERVLSVKIKELSKEWHAAIVESYRAAAAGRQLPSAYGRALITEKQGGGELNVAPALSPQGDRLIFLSERELFSIEIFLADARTGRIERKLSRTAVDPHFDSLQFISSAGAWDHSGRRVALGAIAKGDPVLALLDPGNGKRLREVAFPQLGEIFTPSWSPDGRAIAFSANAGGLLDLYVYDLERGSLRRLTDDAYADLQPAWSPDGRSIVFVTDRFSTNLETLEMGNYRLALLDVDSGAVRALPSFENAKNINPQWSADGASIFYLSDRDGITNIYRLELAGGDSFQVTDLVSGVSGITALSPALSSASGARRVVFSAYEAGDYNVYAIDAPAALAGRPPSVAGARHAGLLPGGKLQADVVELQSRPSFGLPVTTRDFTLAPYRPKLALDYIGQPYLAVGADRFGTFVGGGTTLFFSDMLGDHQLATSLQVNGNFEDLAGLVAYENRASRVNWGAVVEQIPYRTGTFARGIGQVEGEPALIEQTILTRQTERRAGAIASYPFSRVFRVEAGATYRNISFSEEQQTVAASLRSGRLLLDETRKLPAPGGLNLGEASGALVYDSSLFGATSPILGRRFRLEAAPTFGTVSYTGLLADYRHYAMPVRPYTLAFRVLHYGRYGGNSEDPRFLPLFIGYPNLVRGYDVDSFSAAECSGGASGSCPVFDQLLGSRMLVGNAELRVPLLGAFGSRNLYGPVPVELAAFYDAGVAWTRSQRAELFGGERPLVRSAGFAARVNLFGYLIAEVDYVRPLDRPGKGWFWQFNFSPGF